MGVVQDFELQGPWDRLQDYLKRTGARNDETLNTALGNLVREIKLAQIAVEKAAQRWVIRQANEQIERANEMLAHLEERRSTLLSKARQ
jgi:hypothetical protein